MAEWIGMLGGLMMVLLVLLFAGVLLCETRILPIGKPELLKYASGLGGWIGAGLLLLLTGALYRFLTSTPYHALDVSSVWGSTSCAIQWTLLRDGADLGVLARQGVLPLSALVCRGFGALLLGADDQAALYLGLIAGGISLSCIGGLWKRGGLALCLPGAVLLFLPCSFSLMTALALSALLATQKGHRIPGLILVSLAALSHPFGAAVLLVIAVRPLERMPGFVSWLIVLILSGAAGWLIHWQGWAFELLLIACLSLMPLSEGPAENPWYPLLPMMLALCSAAVMGCML